MSKERKRRLERYLDGLAAKRLQTQSEAERKEAERKAFHEGFMKVRDTVIRPAFQSASIPFAERGLGADIDVDDSLHSCAIKLRLDLESDMRAELGFRVDHRKRAVRVGRVVGPLREVGSVGVYTMGALVGEFELNDITADLVEAQLNDFIDFMLKAAARMRS